VYLGLLLGLHQHLILEANFDKDIGGLGMVVDMVLVDMRIEEKVKVKDNKDKDIGGLGMVVDMVLVDMRIEVK
jgi:hypothetical protein